MANSHLILVAVFVAVTHSFTISNVDPLLPIQSILSDNAFMRINPLQKPLLVTCPPDTRLNKKTLTCDFKSDTEALTTSVAGQMCVPGGGTTQPAVDCRSFLLCGPSGSQVMKCPGISLFNKALGVCDYQRNAQCCEFVEKNSERMLQDE